jgi:hypothetical protein
MVIYNLLLGYIYIYIYMIHGNIYDACMVIHKLIHGYIWAAAWLYIWVARFFNKMFKYELKHVYMWVVTRFFISWNKLIYDFEQIYVFVAKCLYMSRKSL